MFLSHYGENTSASTPGQIPNIVPSSYAESPGPPRTDGPPDPPQSVRGSSTRPPAPPHNGPVRPATRPPDNRESRNESSPDTTSKFDKQPHPGPFPRRSHRTPISAAGARFLGRSNYPHPGPFPRRSHRTPISAAGARCLLGRSKWKAGGSGPQGIMIFQSGWGKKISQVCRELRRRSERDVIRFEPMRAEDFVPDQCRAPKTRAGGPIPHRRQAFCIADRPDSTSQTGPIPHRRQRNGRVHPDHVRHL